MIALHLSDAAGDFSGTKAKLDADWNVELVGNQDFFNSVRFADRLLCASLSPPRSVDRTQDGDVVQEANSFFDDAFSSPQLAFLSKYIANDAPCVYFGSALVGNEFAPRGHFHPTPLLVVLSDKWFQ